MTWLLKTVQVLNVGATEATVTVYWLNPSQSVTAWIAHLTMPSGEGTTWEGWTAGEPDDQLRIIGAPSVMCWVSGAELPGTRSSRVSLNPAEFAHPFA